MRQCLNGLGQDTTANVAAYLAGSNEVRLATLYLIGQFENPNALLLTDWESPLTWSPYGTFQPAKIKRGSVTSKVGFEVASLEVTWSPALGTFYTAPTGAQIVTASPYQQSRVGYFDNQQFLSWTVYMPTPGDANTLGCSQLFGGTIGDCEISRGSIKFTVNSFLSVTDQYVPLQVVEATNPRASYAGATPPPGFSVVPQFAVIAGSSQTVIVAQEISPNSGQILDQGVLKNGYLFFNSGSGTTLGGYFSPIQNNVELTGVTNYNQIFLYSPLPWPPDPGGDTFYVSASSPLNQGDGSYYGFPYIPQPISAL